MATPLQDFLIKLGFQVDQAGLRKFNESITTTGHIVRDFAGALTGMAVAAEEAVRRTARQFENLFYLSQQTGVSANNLKQWRFAFEQVGLSAADAGNTLAGVAASLRDNPGLRGLAQQIAPGFKTSADVLDGFAKRYRALMDQFGEDTPEVDAAAIPLRRMAELFGISAEQLRQLALNYRETQEARVQMQKSLTAFGFTSLDEASKNATDLGRTLNRVWKDFGIAFDRFITESFPAVNGLLKDFADWLETDGAKKVREWGKEWDAWIKRVEAWFKSDEGKQRLSELKDGAISLGSAILEVGKAFIALSDKIGPLQALAVTVFGVVLAKAVATTLAVDALALSFGALQTAILAIGSSSVVAALAPIMAFLAAMTLFSKPAAPKAEGEVEKRLGDEANRRRLGAPPIPNAPPIPGVPTQAEADKATHDANVRNEEKARELEESRRRFRGEAPEPQMSPVAPIPPPDRPVAPPDRPVAPPDRPVAPPDRPVAPPDRPVAPPDRVLPPPERQRPSSDLQRHLYHRTSYYEEGGGDAGGGGGFGGISYEELLLRGFTSWWSGSAAFRPIVTIADEFFSRLAETLREVFDLNLQGGGVAGGVPGEAPAAPGGGGHAGGRAPGKVTPGGDSTTWFTGSAPASMAEHGGFNFAGIRAPHGGFRTYPSEFAGVADTARLLQNYGKSGYNTLSSIINRWAPASDNNNTALLIKRASEWMGVDPSKPLDLSDQNTMTGLLDAMNRNEFGGKRSVSQQALQGYVKRFLGGEGPGGEMAQGGALTQGSSGRFSGGGVNLGHVNKALVSSLEAASAFLPEGYSVQATSGERTGGLSGSQHHGGQAMDVQIVGPDGKPLANRGTDTSGMYRRLAHSWFNQVSQMFPGLADRAAWGGEFETSPGSGTADLMHFDFGGRRGRMQRNDWRYIDSDHNTTINIHSMTDDPHGHARVIKDIQGRQSALHTRNLRTSIA